MLEKAEGNKYSSPVLGAWHCPCHPHSRQAMTPLTPCTTASLLSLVHLPALSLFPKNRGPVVGIMNHPMVQGQRLEQVSFLSTCLLVTHGVLETGP